MPPFRTASFRSCVCETSKEIGVFVCDVLSQPHYGTPWRTPDPSAATKSSRALPLARSDDVVVLGAPPSQDYLAWLKELGLGPRHVVVYDDPSTGLSIADRILTSPKPLKDLLAKLGRSGVYVPFYAGEKEMAAAQSLGLPLLGCSEDITLRFFNKEVFKEECRSLEIPTVEGASHEIGSSASAPSCEELESLVTALLANHSSLIVRPTLGGLTPQVYRAESLNVSEVVTSLSAQHPGRVLIEPLLKVIASPNDQWCITRSRRVEHLGMSTQLFDGLKHTGNLKGQFFSERTTSAIESMSERIAQRMSEVGYRGVLSIDYIISDQGIFPIQNNARLNGSTFAFGIIENLERLIGHIQCWKFLRVSGNLSTFGALRQRLSPVLFDGIRKNSLFIFDTDSLPTNGSVGILAAAEDMYHIEYLEGALREFGLESL